MRVSRVFTDQPLAPDDRLTLDERVGHYLVRVLKLREGDMVVFFNGDGHDYAAELLEARRGAVVAQLNARLPAVAESAIHLTLAQAIGKGDRMDYSLQKATELGVARVRPLFTERTEVRLRAERLKKRMSHWQGVLVSACEQSGRARVPELEEATQLMDWLAEPLGEQSFVLDPRAEHSLAASCRPLGQATVIIGPEGGFTEIELDQLTRAGALKVSLGPRVLRTETAGPAALTVLQTMLGDFAAT